MKGSWITANLQAALEFFSACMKTLYDVLMINPITFQDGGVWSRVDMIYNALLAPSLSIMIMLFYIGLIEDTGELIKYRRAGNIVWTFIIIMIMSGVLIYGKYLLLLIFWIGRELMDKTAASDGTDFLSLTWVELPDAIVNATRNLGMSEGIVFWIVTFFGALVVMVVCFTILLTVYGRLFHIFMHIAFAPIAISMSTSKMTRASTIAFIKSFVAVCLEGVVIMIACIIFSAFTANFNIKAPTIPEENKQVVDEITNGMDALLPEDDSFSDFKTNDNGKSAQILWTYLAESMFIYILLASVIKGTDDWLHRKLNI